MCCWLEELLNGHQIMQLDLKGNMAMLLAANQAMHNCHFFKVNKAMLLAADQAMHNCHLFKFNMAMLLAADQVMHKDNLWKGNMVAADLMQFLRKQQAKCRSPFSRHHHLGRQHPNQSSTLTPSRQKKHALLCSGLE